MKLFGSKAHTLPPLSAANIRVVDVAIRPTTDADPGLVFVAFSVWLLTFSLMRFPVSPMKR